MADEDLSIEPVSLITKDFPIVVIKENAPLTDDRRAQLLEQLDDLLESGKPHALIMDLTNASELPEEQRVFISESLQMRAELVEMTWISMAIVVSSNAGTSAELASFWQKATRTQSQVFTNMMSAVVWTRQTLEKYTRANREAGDPSDTSTGSSDPYRRSEAAIRRSEVQAKRSSPKPQTQTSKKNQAEAPRSILRSPVFWPAVIAVLVTGGIFALNASYGEALSSSEQEAFLARKAQFTVNVFRKVGPKRVPLANGKTCPPGSTLRFEAALPAKAYMLILGARSDKDSYVALAERTKFSVGPIAAGKSMLSPTIELSTDEGQEWLHFVACSERITTEDCKLQDNGSALVCPSSCAVSTFLVNKASAGT